MIVSGVFMRCNGGFYIETSEWNVNGLTSVCTGKRTGGVLFLSGTDARRSRRCDLDSLRLFEAHTMGLNTEPWQTVCGVLRCFVRWVMESATVSVRGRTLGVEF